MPPQASDRHRRSRAAVSSELSPTSGRSSSGTAPAAPVIGEDLGAVGGGDRAHAAAPSVAGLAAASAASTDRQDAASTVATGVPGFLTVLRRIGGAGPSLGMSSRPPAGPAREGEHPDRAGGNRGRGLGPFP